MKVVLITGSRHWTDTEAVNLALMEARPDLVIEGAATGADQHAQNWARARGVALLSWPDDHWGGHVPGPTRNGYMVEVASALAAAGWDAEVLAFPAADSRGTWSCVNQAKKAGLPVRIHPTP